MKVLFKFQLDHILYTELADLDTYVHRASAPEFLGKLYGNIYSQFTDVPGIKSYINREVKEISDYHAKQAIRLQHHFQETFYPLLKHPPVRKEDIHFMSYWEPNTSGKTSIEISVNYTDQPDGFQEIIIDDSNVMDYFNVHRVFKQDRTQGYGDAEEKIYTMLRDGDYYYQHNTFPDVPKYAELSTIDESGSCRNFTFQVTEDCNLRCFGAGTKILMADFTEKDIEDIKVGDLVMGFDEDQFDTNGAMDLYTVEVLGTGKHEGTTYPFYVDGEVTRVTKDHKYITGGLDWSEVQDLEPGYDTLWKVDSNFQSIEVAHFNLDLRHPRTEMVYNFETSSRTYVANRIACHNCSYCTVAGTLITVPGLLQKKIEDLVVGDKVIGIDEYLEPGKLRHLKETTVTDIMTRKSECIKISHPQLEHDLIVTPEHPILTPGGWVPAGKLPQNGSIYYVPDLMDGYPGADTDAAQYHLGYLIGAWLGDGMMFHKEYGNRDHYSVRFVGKDEECLSRVNRYCKEYDITVNAIAGTRPQYEMMQHLIIENLGHSHHNDDPDFMRGFVAGVFDTEGSNDGLTLRITNTDMFILYLVQEFLSKFGFEVIYDKLSLATNLVKTSVQIVGGAVENIRFFKEFKPAITRKGAWKNLPHLQHQLIRGIRIDWLDGEYTVYNLTTEAHTFIANNVVVHNCYQINKCARIMDLETGKSAVDDLLMGAFNYLSPGFSKSIILEFIGGDPLLEIDLIGEIYQYFLQEAYRLNHPWFYHHRISMCTNAMLYFSENTKRFFDKFARQVSFNVSIDGNKALHDSCRIQPTGEGSYDIGIAAVHHSTSVYRMDLSSKMTLAPSNVPMIAESVKNLCFDNDYPGINLNCVFEEVWHKQDAKVLYEQLIKVADMVYENNRPDLFFSIYRNLPLLKRQNPADTMTTACGGTGAMLSLDPSGIYYPCIRYMPSSLGDDMKPIILGDTKKKLDINNPVLYTFSEATTMTQQNDKCLSCLMNEFCGSCAALCYQYFGTPNEKTLTLCDMARAQYLAAVYYWAKIKMLVPEFHLKLDDEIAPYYYFEDIVDRAEYDRVVSTWEEARKTDL